MSFEVIRSPYDGRIIGEMPVSSEVEVERVVSNAHAAFDTMRRLPSFVRADILLRASGILERRREEVASLISAEAGKPLYDARGEVARSIFNLSNAAAEANGSIVPPPTTRP